MNDQQTTMDQQDTMSFKGQMAARYRERMSMGFTLSNNVTAEEFSPNLFTTVEGANADIDNTQHKNAIKGGDAKDLENQEALPNRIDVKTILPSGRSRSTMGRATFFPKPAMKDLITKFEKRSYTVHQLKRDQEADGGKIRFPETRSAQDDGQQIDLERIVRWTKGGALKNTSPNNRMSPRLNAQNHNVENVSPKGAPQATNDGQRNESLLGDQQSSSSRTTENDAGGLTMNCGITPRPLEENGLRNCSTESRNSPAVENVIDPSRGPSSPFKGTSGGRESTRVSPENEHKMQSPLRISLRGLVNTKKSREATKAEYVVHKKEWGSRYQTKVILGDENMFHVPYTVHEVHSKTKSDGGRSAMTTPSNTQQRIDKRHSHRCLDTKQEDQEAAGKDEKKSNAMQRYMKFLRHVTPPKPTASNDKFIQKPSPEVTTPRNESPHRTQIVRKLKKPLPKKSTLNVVRSANHGNAGKARTKAFEVLTNKKNGEKSGQYSKIKSRLMMPKKSANKQTPNNEPVPERKKPPERKKTTAKSKVVVKHGVTKTDGSGGDNAANAVTNSTVSITSSIYEELHQLNAPGLNGSLKSGRPVLSRLPRSKLLTKTRPKLQELEAKTPTQSNSCTSNNYLTLDHENGDNMEANKLEGFIASMRGCSTPEQTPEAESSRSSLTLRSSIRSEGDLSTYPVEFRGAVSPLKESNGFRSKSSPAETRKAKMVNSPKDIRKKLFEMMDKEMMNISEAILTEDELADNDLIPCHLRDRRVQSPVYLSCNENLNDPQFAHQMHAPKSQTKRRKISASPASKDVAEMPRNPARNESGNTEKNNNTKNENSSPNQKAYSGGRSPPHELRGKRGSNSSRQKKALQCANGLLLTESSKDDVMGNLDSVNPDSKKNVGGNALAKKPTSRLAKKGDNSNFNIPPEECMSFLTIEDEDRSVYEDRLATPNPVTPGPHGEEVVAYRGFLHKHGASPSHSPRQRTRRDIKSFGLSGSYNETHISSMAKVSIRDASKDIAKDFGTRSRRTTEDTLLDGCKNQEPPANHYHFGDSETKLDDSSDDGKKDKSPGSSPQKKRRRLEKPLKLKRKKIRRVVESNDEDTEISHSLPIDDRILCLQKSLRESKLRDKRKDKPQTFVGNLKRVVSNTSLVVSKQNTPEQLRSKTGDDVTTVLHDRSRPSQRTLLELSPVRTSTYDDKRAMKRQGELPDVSPLMTKKTLSNLDQYSMVKRKNSFMEASLSTSSALPLRDKDSLRDQQTSQWNDTQTADFSYLELPRIQPVRRLSSGPTGGFHNKSAIPLRTDSPSAPRKRADLLIQYRRWRESLMDCGRPSKIPLSERFRRALDSAVIEEWAMHCWLPNHDIYLDAHDPWWCSPYDLVSDEDTMSTSMISDGRIFSKDSIVEFGSRLPYIKVGPLRMLHATYLVIAMAVMVFAHLAVQLYQCGGDEYDYFCNDDDLECLVQPFIMAL
ncbi:unnamed protein product [Lymnaea stagnalis]|uniref:Uncharacterized protein n=1 Tax=Lymnaea stagnalis TaxID=6523 RepID=A0AAV2HXB4_LYMST